MKFNINQQELQQALNYCQGVIEKRSTLPILSNILLDVQSNNLTITATDLDLIFIHQIENIEVLEEGKTTTVSSTIYDIVRKLSSGKKINLTLTDSSKAGFARPVRTLENARSSASIAFVIFSDKSFFRSSIPYSLGSDFISQYCIGKISLCLV